MQRRIQHEMNRGEEVRIIVKLKKKNTPMVFRTLSSTAAKGSLNPNPPDTPQLKCIIVLIVNHIIIITLCKRSSGRHENICVYLHEYLFLALSEEKVTSRISEGNSAKFMPVSRTKTSWKFEKKILKKSKEFKRNKIKLIKF